MSALPSQSRYIIGTEACERFSFYGMKSILMLYMTGHLLMSDNWATSTLHIFVGMVYLLPLAGAWLADKVWGRYKTILYISLLYCVGHGVLATADLFHTIEARRYILMAGLFIIALGAGGIKPCVSAFMGDQIPNKSPQLMTKAFNAFYWAINLGSFFSFLVIPAMEQRYGYSWAFAVPGLFMGVATFVFWLGRKKYHKNASGPEQRAAWLLESPFHHSVPRRLEKRRTALRNFCRGRHPAHPENPLHLRLYHPILVHFRTDGFFLGIPGQQDDSSFHPAPGRFLVHRAGPNPGGPIPFSSWCSSPSSPYLFIPGWQRWQGPWCASERDWPSAPLHS